MAINRRNIDPILLEIHSEVKAVKKILMPEDGSIGLCEQVRKNKTDIEQIKEKPNTIRNWVLGIITLINGAIASLVWLKKL